MGDDSIVKEWNYLDSKGQLTSGSSCIELYKIYKESSPLYENGKLIPYSLNSNNDIYKKNKILYFLREKTKLIKHKLKNTDFKMYLNFILNKIKRKLN